MLFQPGAALPVSSMPEFRFSEKSEHFHIFFSFPLY